MEQSPSHTSSFIIPAVILGLSLVAATGVGAMAMYKVKALANNISVTGSAEQTITSDVAKWSSTFSRTVDTVGLKDGYKQMAGDLAAVQGLLHARGITDAQITVQPTTASQNTSCADQSPNGNCNSTVISGYTLSQTIIVEANDVQLVTKLAQDAPGALADKGVVFESQAPEYYYSKLADLKLDMLTAATQSAKARAEKIVDSAGSKLGKLQSADMGVFQVTPVNSTEISDYGTYDTTSIPKKVTAIVRGSFSVE